MCLQNVFSGLFSPRGRTSLLQEQILSFRVQISFPFRADPNQEKFLSRKANRESQKLLYFIKMAEERGTVSSYLMYLAIPLCCIAHFAREIAE